MNSYKHPDWVNPILRFKVQGAGIREKSVPELMREFFDAHGCKDFYTATATSVGQTASPVLDPYGRRSRIIWADECKASISEEPATEQALYSWKRRALEAEHKLAKVNRRLDRTKLAAESAHLQIAGFSEQLSAAEALAEALGKMLATMAVNRAVYASQDICQDLRLKLNRYLLATNKL